MADSICIYPGSFDPLTNGHMNLIKRSLGIFETVIVAIAVNSNKTPLFTSAERSDMIEQVVKEELPEDMAKRVRVEYFQGLLVDYANEKKAKVVIRGLRAVSDFEYEFTMASMNRKLSKDMEMMFMMTDEKAFYISSQTVKEVASLGGCIDDLVPKHVKTLLLKKYGIKQD